MATTIEWTDETWNPTTGCDRCSPGCAHCYAKEIHDRRHKAHLAGKKMLPQYHVPFEVVQTHESRLDAPLHWRRPRMVFVDSMSDLFYGDDEDRRRAKKQGIPFHPVPFKFIDRVFARMAVAPRHTFQVLTKRAARMREYFTGPHEVRIADAIQALEDTYDPRYTSEPSRPSFADYRAALRANRGLIFPLANVWLGVSVENQHSADERIPLLLQTPAAIRFISAEPLLGPIDLRRYVTEILTPMYDDPYTFIGRPGGLQWVIVGGESGPKARPCDLAWVRSIVQQCKAAGVPVFVKQLGANPYALHDGPDSDFLDLRDTKGGDPSEWPPDLRIRQYPEVRQCSV